MTQEFNPNPRLVELEELLGKKYKILSKIGSGGFGDVFLGEHLALRRKVAIKILHGTYSAQQDLVKRFQREARSAASLSHPNIIDIYDVGEGEGLYYFVMKYIEGETLAQRMQRGNQLLPAESVHIIRQLADALGYAHENDVVHRDIKPANVMLDAFNRALLMDFGVARVQFEGNLTRTGTILGTPHYLPPEQPLGKPVDGRSDIYSLGIMFYEMLSGRLPFQDDNSISLIFKHINEIPPPIHIIVPDLHPELAKLIHKMIEKNPDNRFQHAGEIVDALQGMSGLYPAPTPVPTRKSTPSVGRNTEQLLLLAREHLEQDKMSKALEIYSVVSKRDPKNDTVRSQVDEILSRLLMRVEEHISSKDFLQAKDIMRQLEPLAPSDYRVGALRKRIAEEERSYSHEKETEFKLQFDPSQELNVNPATSQATKGFQDPSSAETMIPTDSKIQEILKHTGDRITSEDRKEVFDRLREIDAALTTEAQSDTAPAPEVPTSVQEKVAPSKPVTPAGPKKPLFNPKTVGVLLLIGAIVIGGTMGLSWFLNKQSEITEAYPELSFLRKLGQSKDTSEKPTTGQISITSTPAGARVFLGEEEKGVTPLELSELPFGKYVLKLKLDGYKDLQQEVDLTEAVPVSQVPAVLEATIPVVPGILMVESTPPGAHIIIKNRALGVTPKKFENMNPGKYSIILKMDGFQDYAVSVKVVENETATIKAELQEIPKQVPVEVKPVEPEVKPGMLVEITDPGVTPPKSIKKTSLDYSRAHRDLKRYSGTVKLNILISETGQVIDAKVTQSAHPVLDQAAVTLVKEWTYAPAKKQGVPVRVWLPASITFVKR